MKTPDTCWKTGSLFWGEETLRFQPSVFILADGNQFLSSRYWSFQIIKILKENKTKPPNQKKPQTSSVQHSRSVFLEPQGGCVDVSQQSTAQVLCSSSALWLLLFMGIAAAFPIRSIVMQTPLCGRISKIKTNSAPSMRCLNGSSWSGYLEQRQFP